MKPSEPDKNFLSGDISLVQLEWKNRRYVPLTLFALAYLSVSEDGGRGGGEGGSEVYRLLGPRFQQAKCLEGVRYCSKCAILLAFITSPNALSILILCTVVAQNFGNL